MKTIKIKCLTSGEVEKWTIDQVLEEINRDHSDEYTPYDESDWEEGWKEWVEGIGFYSLIKN